MSMLFRSLLLLAIALLLTGTLSAQVPVSSQPTSGAPLPADDLAAVRAAEAHRVAAIERVTGTVVAIYGDDRKGGGSGVLFHPHGYALTNHHVVAAAGDSGWAGLADGRLYRWDLLGTDPGGDVAIIRLRGRDNFPFAQLGNSDRVRMGDWALAMGNPFVLAEDQRPTVTLGVVSGVQRFQPGDDNDLLVYGNCLQVDTSINPGNSGGPLFDLRGEVIGINGRCSFEERGRVNVGLGYSISSNQTRHFIPDLLATKTVQHGTLDCQFGDRSAGVVCQSLNLNAPVAQAGLQLGDRLVSFEGYPISHANQFTNLITIYPADWPCEITFEHEGVKKTVHVRLTPLPYKFPQPRKEEPAPEAPSQPPDEAEGKQGKEGRPREEGKRDDGKQGQPRPPAKRPSAAPTKSQVPLEAGQIRFPELNREACQHLLQLSRKSMPGEPLPEAIRVVEERRSEDRVTGEIETLLQFGQRWIVRERVDGRVKTAAGFDGAAFWRQSAGEAAETIPFEKAVRDPLLLQAVVANLLHQEKMLTACGDVRLEGGDKAARQVSARLAIGPAGEDAAYLWLGLFNSSGDPAVLLLKSGIGLHDDEPVPSLLYDNWQTAAGIHWPHRKRFVTELAERPGDEIVTREVQVIPPDYPLLERKES